MQVEKLVSTGGGIYVAPFRGQRRRIENNQIKLSVDFFQVGEGIAFEQLSGCLSEAV